MTFLAPLALWGGLALLIPLLLHLRRRRVGRTIQVGSLRHLETLPTAERRGPRVRDPWRLLLRTAIVVLLAALLARPVLDRNIDPSRPFILVDERSSSRTIDSLDGSGTVRVERIDDPWRRVQELDDSLPAGVPLVVAATSRSDSYAGPRPTVGRPITWIPLPLDASTMWESPGASPPELTREERAALLAALSAVAESFGPLADTAGWMTRLPRWWRDSLDLPAFPVAVAHAVTPAKSLPPPVALATAQLLPREVAHTGRGTDATELHWWLWGVVAALFLLERLWARSLRERT